VPDHGDIKINGLTWSKDGGAIKQQIGVQPQSSKLFDLLTVYETLDVFASFYNKSVPAETILELVNLTDHQNKKVKALSGGQKQRLAIGLALVNDPEMLFLDEPTTGLDPQARRNIWDILLKLKEMGKTTILTTHYMEEAEKLSDRVCIVDQGRIVTMDSPSNLIKQMSQERSIELQFAGGPAAAALAREHADSIEVVTKSELASDTLMIRTTAPEEALYRLLQHTTDRSLPIEQITIRDISLEDVFIAYTGKEWRD
jgi:ABC-2 type transport system ATP-binding protein